MAGPVACRGRADEGLVAGGVCPSGCTGPLVGSLLQAVVAAGEVDPVSCVGYW